jgi:Tfp pilus assembly pilus retraction ATPase PilT
MYSMNDLLNLACSERAEALMLRVGRPPVIVLLGDRHEVGASEITDADVEDFLLCIADTRQRREIWENGQATFIYMKGESERFLVRVWMEGEHIVLEIK